MLKLKKLAALCLALLMSCSFALTAGCNKDESSSSPTNTATDTNSDGGDESESDESEDTGSSDTGSSDTGSSDTGSSDTGSSDTGSEDEGGDEDEHNWDEGKIITPATCTTEGVKLLTCTDENCNATKKISVAIDENAHKWEWVMTAPVTCTEDGAKSAVCAYNPNHTQSGVTVTKRGHEYDGGKCVRCEEVPTIPEAEQSPTYINNYDKNSPFGNQTGGEYNRYEVVITDDSAYYEFELERSKAWISLSVPEAGQYAVYTVGEIPANATLVRYDASVQYIPIDEDGNYIGEEAVAIEANSFLPEGTLFSDVNCSTMHWSTQWRATWCFSASLGSLIKLRFVRLDEPAWIPEYVYEDIFATEINGVTAPEAEGEKEPAFVPYESNYFFDESCGYYRMGTQANPGEIIFVAITSPATRLLQNGSFNAIQYEGNNLCLGSGYTVDGNYFLKNYVPLIMNNGGVMGEEDENANCYENYVNSDGLYPVTKELFNFLNDYVSNTKPMDIPDEIWNDEATRNAKAWLAPCYYYAELTEGSLDRPVEIGESDFGTDITVNTVAFDYVYYTVKYSDWLSGAPTAFCTVSSTDSNAKIKIGGKTLTGPFSVHFETDEANGFTFMLAAKDGSATSFTINVDVYQATEITQTGEITLATQEFIAAGGSITHQGIYTFTASVDGIVRIPVINEAGVSVTVNGTPITLQREELVDPDTAESITVDGQNVNVEAGEVTIIITATEATSHTVEFGFIPAQA